MPSITSAAKISELDAVNSILANIGQSPVNSLTENSVDIGLAINQLGNVSRELQMRGWSFNVDKCYTLTPNPDDKIAVESNVLAIDVDSINYPEQDVVIRGAFLYNRYSKSFTFTGDLEVDITWFLSWDDLPPHAQNYIMVTAAIRMADDTEASTATHRFGQEEQLHAWNAFKSQEIDTNDANLIRYRKSAGLRRRGW